MNYNEAYGELCEMFFSNGKKVIKKEDLPDEIIKGVTIEIIRKKISESQENIREMFWNLFDHIWNYEIEEMLILENALKEKEYYKELHNALSIVEKLDDNLLKDAVEHIMNLNDLEWLFRRERLQEIKLAIAVIAMRFYKRSAEFFLFTKFIFGEQKT